jgi:hypothetical protein
VRGLLGGGARAGSWPASGLCCSRFLAIALAAHTAYRRNLNPAKHLKASTQIAEDRYFRT